jgi:hypothetical protein
MTENPFYSGSQRSQRELVTSFEFGRRLPILSTDPEVTRSEDHCYRMANPIGGE